MLTKYYVNHYKNFFCTPLRENLGSFLWIELEKLSCKIVELTDEQAAFFSQSDNHHMVSFQHQTDICSAKIRLLFSTTKVGQKNGKIWQYITCVYELLHDYFKG